MDPLFIRLFEITGDTRALEMRRAHNMMLTGGDKCRVCGATTNLRNGLCRRHREEARENRGTCIVCGNACDDRKKYICDGCQHAPGGGNPSPPASSSAASSAAAAKATTHHSDADASWMRPGETEHGAKVTSAPASGQIRGPRCGICWGVGSNLEQYDDNLYHPACLIQWEADWTRVRGTSLPIRRIPRGYVPLSRLPPKHRLRFARKEAFIPMTFDEYKRVHMIRCRNLRKKCTEHHIQSDWTSHNDIYRQQIHGWREDTPSKQHIRGPASPPPLGVLEDVELRVEIASNGTRYAIYNPHFLLLDGKPLTDNQFDRLVQYIQERKRPTPPQNPDTRLRMDDHPLMFQHIGGREENVTVDEVIGNPSNILASEIIAYVKRRRQHTPGSNSSGAGAASKSSSSSSSSSGAASAASKPPGNSAAASGSRKRKEQSLPLSSPRIVQRRRVEEFEGDEDDPVIIDDDE